MGKLIYILILLLSINLYHTQKLTVLYQVDYKAKKGSDSLTIEEMLLQIDWSEKESIFKSNNRIKHDSLIAEINKLGNSQAGNSLVSALPKYDINTTIHKKIKKNKLTISESIADKWYSTDFTFPTTWFLENDVKTIHSYKCKKAKISFGGRIWHAWYAPEIPFQDGPYKFHGLPGLILEIYSEDGDYSFTTSGIIHSEAQIIPVKSVTLSKEQLLRLKQLIAKDPSAQLILNANLNQQTGATIELFFDGKDSTKSDKDFLQRTNTEYWNWMSRHNNPIELGDIWLK